MLYQIELRPFDTGPSPAWEGTSGQLSIGFAARLRQRSRRPLRRAGRLPDYASPSWTPAARECLELGLFLRVVALPLAITPFTTAPFADPKSVAAPALGALLLWLGGVRIDRRLACIAAAWVDRHDRATAIGVDPAARHSWRPRPARAAGSSLTICCAVLLVCGAGLPRDLVGPRAGLAGLDGVAVSAVLLVYRLAPASWPTGPEGEPHRRHPRQSALRGRVRRGGDGGRRRRGRAVPATPGRPLAFMTVAVTSTGERSSLILPIVALGVAWWRARRGWRATLTGGLVVLGAFAAWQVAEPLLPGGPRRAARSSSSGSTASDTPRITVWRVATRAPGSSARSSDGGRAPRRPPTSTRQTRTRSRPGRGAGSDAHDLFLEAGRDHRHPRRRSPRSRCSGSPRSGCCGPRRARRGRSEPRPRARRPTPRSSR